MNNWKITHTKFDLAEHIKEESLFTVANGYLGFRGDMEEEIERPYSKRGTFLNGFYEKSRIPYGESAYGYAKDTQTMLNVADVKKVLLSVNDETFQIEKAEMSEYERVLDMEHGILTRKLVWNTKKSGAVLIATSRCVSMVRKNIGFITYQVTPLDQEVALRLTSGIDGTGKTGEETDDPRVAGGLGDGSFDTIETAVEETPRGRILILAQKAKRTGQVAYCQVRNNFLNNKNETFQLLGKTDKNKIVEETAAVNLKKGECFTLQKLICYTTNRHCMQEESRKAGKEILLQAEKDGIETLKQEQVDYYKAFWENSDISTDDDKMTVSMRFNIFQLLQSVGREKGLSIAAKGLSGEGYGGHFFWESEAYILTVFLYTAPEIARNLLEYRYEILDKAREQARLLGHEKGALYSWRSINGEECSAYFLGGSSQYHINGDVAFGIARYLDATQDEDFLRSCAVEMLLETARLWICVGHYNSHKDGAFCIDGVTGPDEYTAMVNNNYYTNIMARENLRNAVKYAKLLKEKNPVDYDRVTKKIAFEEAELESFREAADKMYLPYDDKLKLHMQDDSFLDKKVLDLKAIPPEKHPLLRHYHPLYIYRHQVCKQADLILAEYFLPDYFSQEEKFRDYQYYEAVTTHDSSLSASIFSIMAADIGDIKKAYQYFIQTVRTDLDDNQRNTKDGLHMANMAGAWLCIVHGFAGMKTTDGTLSFQPILPDNWKGYAFSVRYRGKQLHIQVSQEEICYELEGDAKTQLQIIHNHERINLHGGKNKVANK